MLKYFELSTKAWCKSKPGMLLPEPFPSSPSIHISIVGLKNFSVIRDATIPITPWCQFSSANTILFCFSNFSFSINFIAWSNIFFSVSCLCRLYWFSFCVISLASFTSSVKNSLNASSCFPILPHAFILGAIPNEIMYEFISLYPVSFINCCNPILFVHFISIRPNFAITLFSSTNGTISDMVPMHTISRYFKYSFSFIPSFIDNA